MLGNVMMWFSTVPHIWKLIGFGGSRRCSRRAFIVQWFQSETGRAQRHSARLLVLQHRRRARAARLCDLCGRTRCSSSARLSGLMVYSRNLYLIFRERSALRAAAQQSRHLIVL